MSTLVEGSRGEGPPDEAPIEVEVERLPRPDEVPGDSRRSPRSRFRAALEPIAAGIVLDVIDFVPLPPLLGFLLGVLVASQLVRHLRLRVRSRALLVLACGAYCAVPFTNVLPLATLLGAAARFLEPEEG